MCVLGLCALIDLEQIPQVLNQVAGQILPAFILLFNGLKRAYACHAEHENDSDDDDEAEEDEETGMETEDPLLCSVFHVSWWIRGVVFRGILQSSLILNSKLRQSIRHLLTSFKHICLLSCHS